MTRTAFVYRKELSEHVIRKDHPLQPTRLQRTFELLQAYRAFEEPSSKLLAPAPASETDLLSFHTQQYIDAVKLLSQGKKLVNPSRYNFNKHGDNPPFAGMYEASLLAVGATLNACDQVLDKKADVAFNISGGLHHAKPGAASGFCVFNDVVIAINRIVDRGLRVAYIDIDAHHADGVQEAFYETDQVLNISVHESGRFLFPGTGEADETGSGKGAGYTVNIPLAPHTNDEIYVGVFNDIVFPLIDKFRPDLLVSQLGCDAHYLDPLTHLELTTEGYTAVVRKLKDLSLPWLALGGGGYDIGTVARCWTLAYGTMMEKEWPDEVPLSYRQTYGIKTLKDTEKAEQYPGDIEQARIFAGRSAETIRKLIFPVFGLP